MKRIVLMGRRSRTCEVSGRASLMIAVLAVLLATTASAQESQFVFDPVGNLLVQSNEVAGPPQIVGQPQMQVVRPGATATFSVVALDASGLLINGFLVEQLSSAKSATLCSSATPVPATKAIIPWCWRTVPAASPAAPPHSGLTAAAVACPIGGSSIISATSPKTQPTTWMVMECRTFRNFSMAQIPPTAPRSLTT